MRRSRFPAALFLGGGAVFVATFVFMAPALPSLTPASADLARSGGRGLGGAAADDAPYPAGHQRADPGSPRATRAPADVVPVATPNPTPTPTRSDRAPTSAGTRDDDEARGAARGGTRAVHDDDDDDDDAAGAARDSTTPLVDDHHPGGDQTTPGDASSSAAAASAHPARHSPRPSPFGSSATHPPEALPAHVFDPRGVQIVSLDNPRAFLYKRFLTDEECDLLIAHSRPNMRKSGVVDAKSGGSSLSDIRTSTGSFVPIGANPTVARLEDRIAAWSQIPVSHGEPIQVLRYEPGQEYRAHFDYFFHEGGIANNRIATVLMYLSDVEEGGETVFPNTEAPAGRDVSQFSDCGNLGRAVKPHRGDALLFWSMKTGGELDPGSSHAGCPVIKGEKWTATKWMHVAPVRDPSAEQRVFYEGREVGVPGRCEDADEGCHGWAENGECEKNPGFMRVSCKMSCGECAGRWREGGYDKPEQ